MKVHVQDDSPRPAYPVLDRHNQQKEIRTLAQVSANATFV